MSETSDRLSDLERQSRSDRLQFLRIELDTGVTLADLAETEYQLQNHAAARSVQHAKDACQTLSRFLSDQLNVGLQRLRKKLDALPGSQ